MGKFSRVLYSLALAARKVALGVVLCTMILTVVVSSCSEVPQREMKVIIRGVNCDPERATMIAEGTNESNIDRFDDLRRSELFRTPGGHHYFVQNEQGYDMSVQLLSRIEAMRLYDSLPEHRMDFTQAFAD